MQYMFLIYGEEPPQPTQAPTPEEMEAFMKPWNEFGAEATDAGVFIAGAGLGSVNTATTIRFGSGEVVVTDGPFAESKEQLGGFYLLDCKDIDHALEWAKKIPAQEGRSIEVRPTPYI